MKHLRQFIHLLFGMIIIFSLLFFGQFTALVLSTIAFILGLAVSLLVKSGYDFPALKELLKNVDDRKKIVPGFGAIMLFLGMILILWFVQNPTVILGAICILVFGDAFSNIVGKTIGKIKIGKWYTLEGTMGGITVSFIVLSTFMDPFIALVASTLAMLSEFLQIEDNILIPVTGAIVLSLLL